MQKIINGLNTQVYEMEHGPDEFHFLRISFCDHIKWPCLKDTVLLQVWLEECKLQAAKSK